MSFKKCYLFFTCSFYLNVIKARRQEEKYEKVIIILAIKVLVNIYLICSSVLCMNYLYDITLPLYVDIPGKVCVLCECKI